MTEQNIWGSTDELGYFTPSGTFANRIYRGRYSDNGLKAGDVVMFVFGSKNHLYPVGKTRTLIEAVGGLEDEDNLNGYDAVYTVLNRGRQDKSKGLGRWLRERGL